jgi:hypothetical protein
VGEMNGPCPPRVKRYRALLVLETSFATQLRAIQDN